MSHVEVTRRGRVLEVKLNKPKVNAIDVAMSQDMGRAFALLRDDPDLWVGILTADGDRIFSAGWDLKALNAGEMSLDNWWETADYGIGGFGGLTENWQMNKPVICALNGMAIGGGFEIAMSCDLIIAADHVHFALPEMPLGIVPDAGALQRLPRLIPRNIAMEMLLLGRKMTAGEAAHYGLVNKVVPKEALMETARAWADQNRRFGPFGDANRERGGARHPSPATGSRVQPYAQGRPAHLPRYAEIRRLGRRHRGLCRKTQSRL